MALGQLVSGSTEFEVNSLARATLVALEYSRQEGPQEAWSEGHLQHLCHV